MTSPAIQRFLRFAPAVSAALKETYPLEHETHQDQLQPRTSLHLRRAAGPQRSLSRHCLNLSYINKGVLYAGCRSGLVQATSGGDKVAPSLQGRVNDMFSSNRYLGLRLSPMGPTETRGRSRWEGCLQLDSKPGFLSECVTIGRITVQALVNRRILDRIL